MARISLHQHFDDDLFICPRAQHLIDRWQSTVETYIHDTSADGRDHAEIGYSGFRFHDCSLLCSFHHRGIFASARRTVAVEAMILGRTT